jgi:voltage-gated potassium channel
LEIKLLKKEFKETNLKMNKNPGKDTVRWAFVFLFLIFFIGVSGFMAIEKYSFIEAFFMTVITMSTVGFREVRNLSPEGMIFTSFLIITSFGLFAYTISSVTRYILDGGFRNYFKHQQLNKRLTKLENHVIVCGYGRNGRQAVEELIHQDEKVVVIELAEDLIQNFFESHPKMIFINGNATHDEALERAMISKAKALITSLPVDADNLFIVLTARQMNANLKIISRATDDNTIGKLKRAGANNVIMPDKIGGIRMAKLVAQADIIEFLDTLLLKSAENANLVEIFCKDIKPHYINKTIAQINIRRISGANLIGMKNPNGNYIFNPSPDHIIQPDDKLFAIGTPDQIEKLKQTMIGGT